MNKSRTNTQTKQLWELIFLTLEIVEENDNYINAKDLARLMSQQTGISVADVPYIINSAQAEYLVTYSLRTNMVARLDKPILPRLVETGSYDNFIPSSKEMFKKHIKKYLTNRYDMEITSNSLKHLISIYETSQQESDIKNKK